MGRQYLKKWGGNGAEAKGEAECNEAGRAQ